MRKKFWAIAAAAVITALASPGVSSAAFSVTLNGSTELGGTGFGNVLSVLSLQDSPTEYGGVSWNGTADVKVGDYNPASATKTVTVAELLAKGVSSTSDNLSILFQVNNAGNQDNPANWLTMKTFEVNLYTAGGALLDSGSWGTISATPVAFQGVGTGTSGYAFSLTFASAAARTAFFSNTGNRLGINVVDGSIANSSDGPDNFFVFKDSRVVVTEVNPVPAPAGLVLAAGALPFLGLIRRRFRTAPTAA